MDLCCKKKDKDEMMAYLEEIIDEYIGGGSKLTSTDIVVHRQPQGICQSTRGKRCENDI